MIRTNSSECYAKVVDCGKGATQVLKFLFFDSGNDSQNVSPEFDEEELRKGFISLRAGLHSF